MSGCFCLTDRHLGYVRFDAAGLQHLHGGRKAFQSDGRDAKAHSRIFGKRRPDDFRHTAACPADEHRVRPGKVLQCLRRPAAHHPQVPGRKLRRLASIRSQASSLHSTANTLPLFAIAASSTLTLPVPAPTSQTMASEAGAKQARTAARTIRFVMGTCPRTNHSSGHPGPRRGPTGAASASSTDKAENWLPAPSAAVVTVIFQRMYPDLPRPSQTNCLIRPPSVGRKVPQGPASPQ